MKFNALKFGLIFWSVFIVALTVHCYNRYTNLIKHFSFTTGKVVDQIPTRMLKGRTAMRPQIEYVIDDSARYFVDKKKVLKIGETSTLIYQTADSRNIQVYSFWMWVHGECIRKSALFLCNRQ